MMIDHDTIIREHESTLARILQAVTSLEKKIDAVELKVEGQMGARYADLSTTNTVIERQFEKFEKTMTDKFKEIYELRNTDFQFYTNKINDRFNKLDSKIDDKFDKIDDRVTALETSNAVRKGQLTAWVLFASASFAVISFIINKFL